MGLVMSGDQEGVGRGFVWGVVVVWLMGVLAFTWCEVFP
mgnify:CR=1 FL=1